MKQVMNQFTGDSADQAKSRFMQHLGETSQWFGEMLYDIKERWIDNGAKITDILVRENVATYLAIVKVHVRYQMKPIEKAESLRPTPNNWTPSHSDIIAVVEKFHQLTPEEKAGRKDGEYEGLSIDFSFSVDGLGIFRVNFSQEVNGCSLSIRILSYELPGFDLVGYPDFYVSFIKNMVSKVSISAPAPVREAAGSKVEMVTIPVGDIGGGGLVLHVGPTGSGKTTAIAAEMNYLAESTTGGIITYENPIEYRYIATKAPVRQYEIGKDIKKDSERTEFQNITRHLLRNNPAVVMIGEARTHEEMKTVLDIASRGHLVFATIHASNVLEAISTLFVAVGEDRHLLANTIKAVVAHKLIRNEAGKIGALHEILIIEQTIKGYLAQESMKAAIDGIKRSVYQEDSLSSSKQTFAKALADQARKGFITPAMQKQIMESNYGLFIY